MFSFLLGKYLEVEVLGFMISKCLTSLKNCFSKWLYHFILSPAVDEISSCSSSSQHWYYRSFKLDLFWWGYLFLCFKRNEKCLLNEYKHPYTYVPK